MALIASDIAAPRAFAVHVVGQMVASGVLASHEGVALIDGERSPILERPAEEARALLLPLAVVSRHCGRGAP